MRNAVMPEIPPNTKPRFIPNPEVFGSISIMKRKNQLIKINGLILSIRENTEKNTRKPITWGIFLIL